MRNTGSKFGAARGGGGRSEVLLLPHKTGKNTDCLSAAYLRTLGPGFLLDWRRRENGCRESSRVPAAEGEIMSELAWTTRDMDNRQQRAKPKARCGTYIQHTSG